MFLLTYRSPDFKKAVYEVFLNEELSDLVTEEERNAKTPEKPKLEDLFKDIRIYIEVRSGVEDRTKGLQKVLSDMGISINQRLYK